MPFSALAKNVCLHLAVVRTPLSNSLCIGMFFTAQSRPKLILKSMLSTEEALSSFRTMY